MTQNNNIQQESGKTLWCIVDRFPSIDTAIEETEKKLQMLEQHKKGLMQRMFVRRV